MNICLWNREDREEKYPIPAALQPRKIYGDKTGAGKNTGGFINEDFVSSDTELQFRELF